MAQGMGDPGESSCLLDSEEQAYLVGVVGAGPSFDTILELVAGEEFREFLPSMKRVEKSGLVKFDFLGLKTITVIDDALQIIREMGEEPPDFDTMDSSGIGFLVSVNTRMRSSGRCFYLYQLSPAVEKTLGLVQLLSFFAILKDECALAAVCG